MLTIDKANGRYISILADGKLHETVSKDTDGAVLREYELKDGTKGEKWELVYSKLEAKITNVDFRDGEFGEQVLLTFSDGDNEVILAQGVASNFGEDILKKLPNVDFAEKLTIQPYAFEDDKGKMVKGVSFYQNGKKLLGYFYDGEKAVHGYPVPEGDTKEYKKEDWTIFYLKARKFLVNYTKENIVPKFSQDKTSYEYPEEEIKPEEIPFS